MYVFLMVGHFFSRHRKCQKLGWDVERAAGSELAAVLLDLKTSDHAGPPHTTLPWGPSTVSASLSESEGVTPGCPVYLQSTLPASDRAGEGSVAS